MPIRSENRCYYSTETWRALRRQVIEEAGDRCEECGVENLALGYRDREGEFRTCDPHEAEGLKMDGVRIFQIVLTVAHMDHDPSNMEPGNLKALCQRCHNRHDASTRAQGRKQRAKATRACGTLI